MYIAFYSVKSCPATCSEQNNLLTSLEHSGGWRCLAEWDSLGAVGGMLGGRVALLNASLSSTAPSKPAPCTLR